MRFPALLAVLGWSVSASAVPAADYVLTIGGGHSPQGNQVSLEKNVRFFSRALEELLPDAKHTILFADGGDPHRDVQYTDPDAPLPRVYELLARVLNQTDHLVERYRNHELPHVDGAASRENIRDWFDHAAETLEGDDRVILYVTAHGGRAADRKRPRNTTLYLWNDEITVDDLSRELDKLPESVPVVVVMVQCYSGGFADLIFNDADVKDRPTAHNRSGFYATTHTRVAAGCTPDIDEADYHEYSSSFWAAILGETRTGEPVEPADYDGDGAVSFAEAHAYVLLTSDTIDIPVTTSDALLRGYSSEHPRTPPVVASRDEPSADTSETDEAAPTQVTALRPVAPLTASSPVTELVEVAGPVEKKVITGLSEQLGLTRPDRAIEARAAAKKIEDERKELRSRIRRLEREYHHLQEAIETDLLAEWPELAGTWNPDARRLVAETPDDVVGLVESHEHFEEFDRLEAEILQREAEQLDLERRWVKCQRLLQTLETVALAHNLPLAADSELLSRYELLRAAEHATLVPAKP
ncbi:MAG: hypothetical protein WBC44_06840 [Planctomycetaceae bacterium]